MLDTSCDRLDAPLRQALERTRATLTPYVPPGHEDLDVLRALLAAAPELERFLRPYTTSARVVAALRHAIEQADHAAADRVAPCAALDTVIARAARVADDFLQDEVTPAHLLMAVLQRPSAATTSCLWAVGLSLPTTLDAISTHLRGECRAW